MEPPLAGGTKVCSSDPGHITKMAAMPIYGKKIKHLLLWNRKADDLETWYSAWVDVDLFHGNVTFGPLCFCMGKKIKQWIFHFNNYYCCCTLNRFPHSNP